MCELVPVNTDEDKLPENWGLKAERILESRVSPRSVMPSRQNGSVRVSNKENSSPTKCLDMIFPPLLILIIRMNIEDSSVVSFLDYRGPVILPTLTMVS